MNSSDVKCILTTQMKPKREIIVISQQIFCELQKAQAHLLCFSNVLIDCDFKYESTVSVEIFIIFLLFSLWLFFSCFCLNYEALSQWWDSAEILLLWYYWLILAFSVSTCVGTYSNHNAQIE